MAEGQWEEALRDLNAKMRQNLGAGRLADGWARMAGLIGAYEGPGAAPADR